MLLVPKISVRRVSEASETSKVFLRSKWNCWSILHWPKLFVLHEAPILIKNWPETLSARMLSSQQVFFRESDRIMISADAKFGSISKFFLRSLMKDIAIRVDSLSSWTTIFW